MSYAVLPKDTQKHNDTEIITYSHMNHPSFAERSAECNKEDQKRKHSVQPLAFSYANVHPSSVIAVSKTGLTGCQSWNKCRWTGISNYLNKC